MSKAITETQPVAIKPLEWEDNRGVGFNATTVSGIYSIDIGAGEYRVFVPGKWPPVGYTLLEAAKAAAQADYEARIRSALVPPAVPGEVERMQDKIEGLEADLENAVEVAFKRGATEWTRMNYPDRYAILAARPRQPEREPDGYLCDTPLGVPSSGPIRTTSEHVQDWRDKGWTVTPYYLSVLPEIEGGDKGDGGEDLPQSPWPASDWAIERIAKLEEALGDLMTWFPEKPSEPEWRIKAGDYGADEAVSAARAALRDAGGGE